MRSKILKNIVYGLLIINLLWLIFHLAVNRPIIPSPLKVYYHFMNIFGSKLSLHTLYSLKRILIGLILSVLIGVPIGILMGYYKKIDRLLAPLLYFTYPIPKISLLPIVMLLFGLGELSKVIMIIIIVIFQIILSTRDAVSNIPKEIYHSLISLGATRYQIFREVILPSSLSPIITSIRVAQGMVISILFFTETYGTNYGIGYFIMDAWMRIDYLDMYSGIVLLSLLGFTLFTCIDVLEKQCCKWRYTDL